MDLIQFNARSGKQDLSVIIKSMWITDGNEPVPELPSQATIWKLELYFGAVYNTFGL